MKPDALEVLIFDWDGTLADTSAAILGGFAHAVRDTAAARAPGAFQALLGQPLCRVHAHLEAEVPRYAQTFEDFAELYRVGHDRLEASTGLFPGVAALLEQCTVPVAIASSKPTWVLDRQTRALGLTPTFAVVQGTDDLPHKPDPAILHRVLGRLGATAERAAFVGDASTDVRAGRAAGVFTVGVTWGAHDAAALGAAEPHAIVDTPHALGTLLKLP